MQSAIQAFSFPKTGSYPSLKSDDATESAGWGNEPAPLLARRLQHGAFPRKHPVAGWHAFPASRQPAPPAVFRIHDRTARLRTHRSRAIRSIRAVHVQQS